MEMRSLNYQDWLLVCFILGVVGGTAAAHFFGGQTVKAQVLGGMGPGSSVDGAVRQALFWQVLRLRFAQLAVGWLMGLTVYSAVLFGLAAVWGGFLDGPLSVMNNVVWDLLDNGTQYIDTIAYSAYYASAGTVI